MVPSPIPGVSPIMATLSPQTTSQHEYHNRQQQQQQMKLMPSTSQRNSPMNLFNSVTQTASRNNDQQQQQQRPLFSKETTMNSMKNSNTNQKNNAKKMDMPTSSNTPKIPLSTAAIPSQTMLNTGGNKFETTNNFANIISNSNSINSNNNNNNNNFNEKDMKSTDNILIKSLSCDKNNEHKSDQDIKNQIKNNNNIDSSGEKKMITIKIEKNENPKIQNLEDTELIKSNKKTCVKENNEINNLASKSIITNFKEKNGGEKRRKSVNQDNLNQKNFLNSNESNNTTQRFDVSKKREILLKNLNPHIICNLCKGYLIDATTIVECLHSFCHSCIMKHLMTEQYCPQCEMMINTAKPNIKPDTTLQAIVYKLVPGLYEKELMRKRAFYRDRPQEAALATPEQRGEDTENLIFSPTEFMSLSLEYADIDKITSTHDTYGLKVPKYLQCPAILTVSHLKKFVVMKFGIDMTRFDIEVMYKVKTIVLYDHYTLMDVAYIYTWKRDAPMRFFFRVKESGKNIRRARRKIIKPDVEALPNIADKYSESLINTTNNVSNLKDNCNNNINNTKIKEEFSQKAVVETENFSNVKNIPDSLGFQIKREEVGIKDNKTNCQTLLKLDETNQNCFKSESVPYAQNGLKNFSYQQNVSSDSNLNHKNFSEINSKNLEFIVGLGNLGKDKDNAIQDPHSVYEFKSDSPLSSPNPHTTIADQQKTEKLKITLVGKNKIPKITSPKSLNSSEISAKLNNQNQKSSKQLKSEQNSSQQPAATDESRKPENIKMKIDISKQDSIKIINMSGPDSIPKEIVKMVKPDKEWKIKVKGEKEERRSSPSPNTFSSEMKAKSVSPQTVPPITIKARKPSPKISKSSIDITSTDNQKKIHDLNEEEKKSEFLNAVALTPIKNVSPSKLDTLNSNNSQSSYLSKTEALLKSSKVFLASASKITEKKRKSRDLTKSLTKKQKFNIAEVSNSEKNDKELKDSSSETISFKLCSFPIGSGSENNSSKNNASKNKSSEDIYKFENASSNPKEMNANAKVPKDLKAINNIKTENKELPKVNILDKEPKTNIEKLEIKVDKGKTQTPIVNTPEFKIPQKHNIINKSISDSTKKASFKKIMPAPPPLKPLDSHKKSNEQRSGKLSQSNVIQNPLGNYHRITSPGSTTPHPNRPMLVPSGIASSQTQQFIAAPGSRTPTTKRYANILPKQNRANPFANIPSDVNKMLKNSGTEIKPLAGPETPSLKVYGPAINFNTQNNPQNIKANSPVQIMQGNQLKGVNVSKNNSSYLNFALMNAARNRAIDVSVGYRTPIYTPNYASSSPIYSPNSPQYVPNYNIPVQPTYKYTPKTNANNNGAASYLQSVLGTNNQFSGLFPAPPVKKIEDSSSKFSNKVQHQQSPENNEAKKQNLLIANKITNAVTEDKDEQPIEKRIKVKSLLNSCNINIPSSLSITITNEEADNRNHNIINPKHKSPVNNYIEILKLPDQPNQEQNSNDILNVTTSASTLTKTKDVVVNSASNCTPSPTFNSNLSSAPMFSSSSEKNQKVSPTCIKDKNLNKTSNSNQNSMKVSSPDKKLNSSQGNTIGEKRKSIEKFSPEKDIKLPKSNDTLSQPTMKKFRHILPRVPQMTNANLKQQVASLHQKQKDKNMSSSTILNCNFQKSTSKSVAETNLQSSQLLKSTNFNVRTNFPNSPTGSINLSTPTSITQTISLPKMTENKSDISVSKSSEVQCYQSNDEQNKSSENQLQQLQTSLNLNTNVSNATTTTVDVANFLQQAIAAAQIQNFAAAAAVAANNETAAAIQAQSTPNGLFLSPHTYTAFSNGFGQFTPHPNFGYTQAFQQAFMLDQIARIEKAQKDQNKTQQLQQQQQSFRDQHEQIKKHSELQQQKQQYKQKAEETKKEKLLQSPQPTFEKQQQQQELTSNVDQKEESDSCKTSIATIANTTANPATTGITALQKLINNVQNGVNSVPLGGNNNNTNINNKKESKDKEYKNSNKIRKQPQQLQQQTQQLQLQQQQQKKTENNMKVVPSLSPTTQMNNNSGNSNSNKK